MSLVNGVIWGGVMGLVAMVLVQAMWRSASCMVFAMTLNLMLAALMGVLIPMTMMKAGRDPAVGLVGAHHGRDGLGRILHLPRARHAVPRVRDSSIRRFGAPRRSRGAPIRAAIADAVRATA